MTLVRSVVRQIAPLNIFLWQVAAASVFMLATFPAHGQATKSDSEKVPLGSIHGTLTTTQDDPSSGLAGISLRLTKEPPDGSPLIADTDDARHYEFKNVKPGTYTTPLSHPGFKPFTKFLSLHAGEAAVLDIRVELQTATQRVEVSEEPQRSEEHTSELQS